MVGMGRKVGDLGQVDFLLPAQGKQDVERIRMQLSIIRQIFLHESGRMISGLSCTDAGSHRCPVMDVVAAQVGN